MVYWRNTPLDITQLWSTAIDYFTAGDWSPLKAKRLWRSLTTTTPTITAVWESIAPYFLCWFSDLLCPIALALICFLLDFQFLLRQYICGNAGVRFLSGIGHWKRFVLVTLWMQQMPYFRGHFRWGRCIFFPPSSIFSGNKQCKFLKLMFLFVYVSSVNVESLQSKCFNNEQKCCLQQLFVRACRPMPFKQKFLSLQDSWCVSQYIIFWVFGRRHLALGHRWFTIQTCWCQDYFWVSTVESLFLNQMLLNYARISFSS